MASLIAVSPSADAAQQGPYPTVVLNQVTSSAGFVHPGIGVSAQSLVNARQQVLAGVEPWASYYAAMIETRFASRTVRSANAGAQTDLPANDAFNSQAIQSKFIEDAFAAYTQAILYVITGDPVHRENGLRIVRIWSHMAPAKYAVYPDARIHSPIPLMRLLAAAELIRYSSVNPGESGYDVAWHDSDTTNLTTNLVVPLTDTFLYHNGYFMNQQAYANVGALAGYIFTDNLPRYREGVEWFSVNSTSPNHHTSGALASYIRRIDKGDPLNPFGYSFVQVQEMGRDQAHAWDGVNALTTTARMLTVQGTRLDPVNGTVSTRSNAVSPYRFRDNRLLAGAEAFFAYMMGKNVPWIDTTGRRGKLSEAYRGRQFEPSDELYDVYKYALGVDVERQAPSVAQMRRQADGPKFHWGTSAYNFWNSNPDYNPDYWLSLPPAVAGQARPPQTNALVQVENRSLAFDDRSAVLREPDLGFVRMHASGNNGTTIAIRTLLYDNRNGYSPVGIRIRTNGRSTLQIRKDRSLAPYHSLTLPDTHGQWRYLTYDMDYAVLPGSTGGENLAYYTVVGSSKVSVDIDHVNLQAKAQLTPPSFPQGQRVTLIGVAGASLSRSLAATDKPGETVTYEAQSLPDGATLDPAAGTLTWTPTSDQVRRHQTYVVASDGTTNTVLNVAVVVAPNRQHAVSAALEGFDPDATYVKATLDRLNATRAAVEASVDTADDGTFLAGLVTLQDAVKNLQLLNPQLADGSLKYPGLVTTTLSATAPANLIDDDINTFSGDLRAPFTLDFGAGFRVRADAFGLQARYNFGNRSQGANVYGSNDGTTWTLLTSRETTDTTAQGFAMETIPVRNDVQGKTFRFFKVQVDHPGVPTDPAYPGLSSFSELRIHGVRVETALAISTATLSSSNPEPAKAINGDTVTLDLVATRPLSAVTATIEGVNANVTSSDNQHWRATAVLPENVGYGRALRFAVDYTTDDGQPGATVYQTTDGSTLELWNNHVQLVAVDRAWVNASTPAWPGTGTTADNGWRMFDGDVSTATDTTSANGWVTVTPTNGSLVDFDAVRVRPRATFPARANGTTVQGSTDGGATWQTLATISGVTSDQQWYSFTLPQHASVPMVRILDEHGGNTNLAEVQFLQFHDLPR
ncbi:putative Ig domain-containing protein [Kribbella sp. NBC_01245]|uniref:putative Ig domain-containing protein n=1 Tax=Kribbella sp. NBC_01245 TaxID=2903578 RepID=UPI002E297A09|nr:putative Ig domain-containing protein [Kribbella sp. NBC_01245]